MNDETVSKETEPTVAADGASKEEIKAARAAQRDKKLAEAPEEITGPAFNEVKRKDGGKFRSAAHLSFFRQAGEA